MNDTTPDQILDAQCQRAKILNHLKQHGFITHRAARSLYGCDALRSRIAELRKEGHDIKSVRQTFEARSGKRGWYNDYALEAKQQAA